MEQETEKRSNNRFGIQLAIIALILIILPAGSWVASQFGLDYFVGLMDDLQDYGNRGEYDLQLVKGNELNLADLPGNLVLVAFLNNLDSPNAEQMGAFVEELHGHFDEHRFTRFLIHVDQVTPQKAQSFLTASDIDDPDQVYIATTGNKSSIAEVAKLAYFLPPDHVLEHTVTLVDAKGQVRRHYDITKEQDRKLLLETVAITTPKNPDIDLVIKREKEK